MAGTGTTGAHVEDEGRSRLTRRLFEPIGRSAPGRWIGRHVAVPVDRRLMRWSKGRMRLFFSAPSGLLTVVGAKSGLVRETPLLYARDGDRIVLIASNFGGARHPAWYYNVVANPEVRFSTGGRTLAYRARQADPQEREAIWPRVVGIYAGYDDYVRLAGDRVIPLILLEPV